MEPGAAASNWNGAPVGQHRSDRLSNQGGTGTSGRNERAFRAALLEHVRPWDGYSRDDFALAYMNPDVNQRLSAGGGDFPSSEFMVGYLPNFLTPYANRNMTVNGTNPQDLYSKRLSKNKMN